MRIISASYLLPSRNLYSAERPIEIFHDYFEGRGHMPDGPEAQPTSARWAILRNTLLNRKNAATRDSTAVTRRPTGRFGLVRVTTEAEKAERGGADADWETITYDTLPDGPSITLR
jgi:hypothetical protein